MPILRMCTEATAVFALGRGHPAAWVVGPIPVIARDAPFDAPADAGKAGVLANAVADLVLARAIRKTRILHQGGRLAVAVRDRAERPRAIGDFTHALVG